MVSGLVIATDKTPYFSRVRFNSRAIGGKTVEDALNRTNFDDTGWEEQNTLITPNQLLEWRQENET